MDAKDPMSMLTGIMGGMMSGFIEPDPDRPAGVGAPGDRAGLWDEHGRRDQSFEVVQYLTDPAKLDAGAHRRRRRGAAGTGGTTGRAARPASQRSGCTRQRSGASMTAPRLSRSVGTSRVPHAGEGAAAERPTRSRRGFTLIEVMLAIAILAFVTAIMWGSFSQTAINKSAIEAAQDRDAHRARGAAAHGARDRDGLLSANDEPGALRAAHVLVGDLARRRRRAGVLGLRAPAAARRARRGRHLAHHLLRRARSRRPARPRTSCAARRGACRPRIPARIPGEAYILCPDVARLKIPYYDYKKKEWENEWNTLNASGNQYLPTHVRITLTVIDERGQEVTYTTDARIQMTERVGYKPVKQ